MQPFLKKFGPMFLICLALGAAGIGLNYLGFLPLLRLEKLSGDLRAVFGRKTPIASDLVLLTIDEASLRLDGLLDDEVEREPAFQLMQQGWPWPRSVHARILQKLSDAGARVVAFDLLFPAPGPGDVDFSAALRLYGDRAVVGATFEGTDSDRPSFNRPSASLVEPGVGEGLLGFANFVPDSDGVVRAALFRASPEDFADRKTLTGEKPFDSIAARMLHKSGSKLSFPAGSNLPFRFGGPPGAYRHRSLYEIFIPRLWAQNFQNGEFFKNKIVIIGPEGGWSHDEHPTPFAATYGRQNLMSGPEIHLQALAAARAGEFIHTPGPLWAAICVALAAIVGSILNSVVGTPSQRCLAFLIVVAALVAAAQISYNSFGLMLPLAAPTLVLAASFLIGFLLEFSRERLDRLRSRATLERYVSSHVASEILDSPRSYLTSLVGVRKEVTVLFTDLRNFTAMVNLMNAQELVTQLNEFYARVIEDVFHHSGTLDKIMGDGLMAVWGNLQSLGKQEDAANAMRAALAMQRSLAALNAGWLAQGRPTLALGIGIAQGVCVVGNIGSERKMDLTVIGEAANLAARLQALTREHDQTLLFDSSVAGLIGETFSVKTLQTVVIRGFAAPIALYTVLSEDVAPRSLGPTRLDLVPEGV